MFLVTSYCLTLLSFMRHHDNYENIFAKSDTSIFEYELMYITVAVNLLDTLLSNVKIRLSEHTS